MSLFAPKGESKFEIVPAGNHIARVYKMIQLGTQQEEYKGEAKATPKILIGFELPNEQKIFKEERGPEPFVISREYTLAMSEKANLRKLIEGMFAVAFFEGEANAFDLEMMLGKPCLLNIIHKRSEKSGNDYALIQGASPIPKGMTVPDAINPVELLTFNKWNEEYFQKLPQFIKDKITASPEYKELKGNEVAF